jgi:dihydroxyacid dehydratase (EC 4.2.1.9)
MPNELNKYSKTLTQDETQPAAQAMYYAIGFKEEDFSKAQVGIAAMGWDGNPCNMHLNDLATSVRDNINKTDDLLGLRFYYHWCE